MPDYTKKNVADLKDSAPEFGFDEIGEARFPARSWAPSKRASLTIA